MNCNVWAIWATPASKGKKSIKLKYATFEGSFFVFSWAKKVLFFSISFYIVASVLKTVVVVLKLNDVIQCILTQFLFTEFLT